MNRILKISLLLLLAFIGLRAAAADRVVVGYVTSWGSELPDPTELTHVNYAFGHVNDAANGVRIDNEPRLRQILALKKRHPQLRVLLSVGGWGSGRFSEMSADEERRKSFAQSCRQTADALGLDGIDIDWEYPTQSVAGISSSPADTRNFNFLMRDLRQALGTERLLTCATVASGEYIDFRQCIEYLDWVNIMAYDMASAPRHHSPLYPSVLTGQMCSSEAVSRHLHAGVPPEKLVLGMPLYGRGLNNSYTTRPDTLSNVTQQWDEQAMVPYLTDAQGRMVMGAENARSLALKCQYIKDHRLRGGMYWEYGDEAQRPLRLVIKHMLMDDEPAPYPADYARKPRFNALFIYDPSAEPAHVEFDRQALQFFHKLSYGEGFTYDVRTSCPASADTLRRYDVVVMLNVLPHDEAERLAFQQYMDGGGGWMGFHATGYNDQNTHWPWLNEFLGCGPFLCNNWPPQPALVDVETDFHPVTRTLPRQFVAPASEFYQFSPSPRSNPDVEVLLSISPRNYPFGIKDIITYGDFPIVWTNRRYRMIYLNMGHGDEAFIDATQNLLFTNAFRWLTLR